MPFRCFFSGEGGGCKKLWFVSWVEDGGGAGGDAYAADDGGLDDSFVREMIQAD